MFGYSDLMNLINTENISAIVDNIIDSVPNDLLKNGGFSDLEVEELERGEGDI